MQMHELDDSVLKRDSEAAFAELVTRHIDKVYSIALRQTRNAHQAEEITQAVFVILARKSKQLSKRVILSGWLYQTARLTAMTFLRSEIRRARREQDALMQTSPNESESDLWPQIDPLLDNAMAALSETDRHAIVLRFFDGKSMKEVGAALGQNEDAAKMRVSRAVEKLRQFFSKRGVVLTATGLTTLISVNSVQAAPAVLAKTVTAIAITKGATVGGSTLTLIKGALKLMAWTKAKTAIVVAVGVLITAGTTTLVVSKITKPQLEDNWFETTGFQKAPPNLLAIRPTKYRQDRFSGTLLGPNNYKLGVNLQLKTLIAQAYGESVPERAFSTIRMSYSEPWPEDSFDYLITISGNSELDFQATIKEQLGFQARRETLEQDVFLLRCKTDKASRFATSGAKSVESFDAGKLYETNQPISVLIGRLENCFEVPVIDETGLKGNFDYVLDYPLVALDSPLFRKESAKQTVERSLLDQLGLELVPSRKPIETLVVEKVK